jgi:hypothetical protein
MKKIFTLLLILFFTKNLQAQFALASYQAVNTKLYSPVDGSIEFSPIYTNGTPTNNQYLSIPASINYAFNGDFTVECWVNFKNVSGVFQSFLGQYISGLPWVLQMNGNQLRLVGHFGGNYTEINSSLLTINTWYHIALVRSGTDLKIYVNGVNNGSATITSTVGDANNIVTIGSGTSGGNDRSNGFISNVRFVKGVAVYISDFTPPTSRLTSIQSANVNGNPSAAITTGQTSLLLNTTNDAKYLKDNSSNGVTVVNYNGVSTTDGLATSSSQKPF